MARLNNFPSPLTLLRAVNERLTNRFPCIYTIADNEYSSAFFFPSKGHYTNLFRLINRMGPRGYFKRRSASVPPTDRRCYLPIRLHLIEDIRDVEKRLPSQVMTWLTHENVHLLFDISGEAICNEQPLSEYFSAFHATLKRLGIAAKRVHLLNANRSNEFYDQWCNAHSPDYCVHWHSYHFYLYAIPHKIITGFSFTKYRAQLLKSARADVKEHRVRPYHFMTLNLKTRPHRMALLVFLLQRGYRDKGVITYVGEEFTEKQPEHESYVVPRALIELVEKLPDKSALLAQYDSLERMRPLTYERTAETIKTIWRTPGDIAYIVPELAHAGGGVHLESYFEIVTETWFTDESSLYLTEKTLRPMFRLQPFIHMGSPRALAALREMGFKTFAPLIDESYDEILDPQARLVAIFEQIDRLCRMPREELHKRYVELWDVLEHNFHHVTTQMPRLFMDDAKRHVLKPLQK